MKKKCYLSIEESITKCEKTHYYNLYEILFQDNYIKLFSFGNFSFSRQAWGFFRVSIRNFPFNRKSVISSIQLFSMQ